MGRNDRQITITIPHEIFYKLEESSKKNHRSISGEINTAIDFYLNPEKNTEFITVLQKLIKEMKGN